MLHWEEAAKETVFLGDRVCAIHIFHIQRQKFIQMSLIQVVVLAGQVLHVCANDVIAHVIV